MHTHTLGGRGDAGGVEACCPAHRGIFSAEPLKSPKWHRYVLRQVALWRSDGWRGNGGGAAASRGQDCRDGEGQWIRDKTDEVKATEFTDLSVRGADKGVRDDFHISDLKKQQPWRRGGWIPF